MFAGLLFLSQGCGGTEDDLGGNPLQDPAKANAFYDTYGQLSPESRFVTIPLSIVGDGNPIAFTFKVQVTDSSTLGTGASFAVRTMSAGTGGSYNVAYLTVSQDLLVYGRACGLKKDQPWNPILVVELLGGAEPGDAFDVRAASDIYSCPSLAESHPGIVLCREVNRRLLNEGGISCESDPTQTWAQVPPMLLWMGVDNTSSDIAQSTLW